MTGTLVNSMAIVAGGFFGLVLGRYFTARYQAICIQAMGLCVAVVGLKMAMVEANILIVILSMALGGVVGEWIDIEARLKAFAEAVKTKLGRGDARFTEGFVGATLLYCVGSLAILGAIEDGLKSDPSLLYTKALMDGLISIPMASSLGLGVLLSSIPVLFYQGSISLTAMAVGDLATPEVIANLTATGGLLVAALGLNLLKITEIPIGNLLPAVGFAVLFGFTV